MKSVEERAGQFIVAGCNGAVDLEMTNHALDDVSALVDTFVPSDRGVAVRAWRNDGPDPLFDQRRADRIAVIPFVGEKVVGLGLGKRHYVFERRTVCRFAACEVEDERDAVGITETMNFTGEPAPRAAKSLFLSPPFAPAAETCPLTVVESMLCRELSAIAWARAVATASQRPAWLQRRKRWYTVIHFPYFSGTSRQGAPVRMRQRMPFTIGRLSEAGRFLRPRSDGRSSFNSRHSASVRSPRLMIPSLQERILESKTESCVNQFVNRP